MSERRKDNREVSLEKVERGIDLMEDKYRNICLQILNDYRDLIINAPGSRHNHQTWPGGYIDHVAECFELADYFIQFKPARDRNFSLSDAYLVIFLHDVEKPFAYSFDENDKIIVNPELKDKVAKKEFRDALIKRYRINLTEMHKNALAYIEGVPSEDYSAEGRVMGELAAFCHVVDTWSARVDHAFPKHS